ncbi:ABC transporter ATP-binding protein [Chlorobaculum sp. 24CR]|uniref:ABC transporter ATP-binding protein n=1 Tax=Chlorobaculum sp. 24CR TaxID=2508878 RepID=UPI001FD6CA4E|nr:ABC transporter ATP-binding protein [Chlorobaculum sp. 24CR]
MPQSQESIISLLKRLWRNLGKKRKAQFAVLMVLMIFTSFAEIFSLGALLPFLGVLTDPESIFRNDTVRGLAKLVGITTPKGMLLPFTFAFAGAALLSGGMRLLQIWANTKVSFATGADISIALYSRTLYQPYAVHVSRNSSTIIDAVSAKVMQVIINGIIPVITMVTASFILISIMATLIFIDPLIALSAFGGFGVTYAVVIKLTRSRLKANSRLIARESTQVVKSLQEGLGGIRDVLIDGTQSVYCDVYSRAVFPLRRAQGNNNFINQSPRFGVETIGMLLIAGLAFWLAGQPGGMARAIPVLGTLALGSQRMLPVLQQLFGGWSALQGNLASMEEVLDLLDQPVQQIKGEEQGEVLPFERILVLRGLSFRYTSDAPEVLKEIDLEIPKGSRIGFIGTTGSGKSTLLDIVMGLLEPTGGDVQVDGTPVTRNNLRSWQRHIAHVPQSIFLSDASIAENIALGVPKNKIDKELVRQAARQAQIADIIESWPKQYETVVGERGVRLSGGQRQRIGIARALYKQADVIIFDEATSALDSQTEEAVMQAIEKLHEELTVLIIAHRLTTLKNCHRIVELENGKIKQQGSYLCVINEYLPE